MSWSLVLATTAALTMGSPIREASSHCTVREQTPIFRVCPGGLEAFQRLHDSRHQSLLKAEELKGCHTLPQLRWVRDCFRPGDKSAPHRLHARTPVPYYDSDYDWEDHDDEDEDAATDAYIKDMWELHAAETGQSVPSFKDDDPVPVLFTYPLVINLSDISYTYTYNRKHEINNKAKKQDFWEVMRFKADRMVPTYNVTYRYNPPTHPRFGSMFGAMEVLCVKRLPNNFADPSVPVKEVFLYGRSWPPTFNTTATEPVSDVPLTTPLTLEQRVAYLEEHGIPPRPHYVPSPSHSWVYVYDQKLPAVWPPTLNLSPSDLKAISGLPLTTEPTIYEPTILNPPTRATNYASITNMSEMTSNEAATVWVISILMISFLFMIMFRDMYNKWQTGEMQEELRSVGALFRCCFGGRSRSKTPHVHKPAPRPAPAVTRAEPAARPSHGTAGSSMEKTTASVYVAETEPLGVKGKEVSSLALALPMPAVTTVGERRQGVYGMGREEGTKTVGGESYERFERSGFGSMVDDAESNGTAVAPGIPIGVGLMAGSPPATVTRGSQYFQ